MRSKIEVRLEAARLVMQLPDTTIDNFHERAYRIELYLQGDAELPEQVDELDYIKELVEEAKQQWKQSNQEHQMRMNGLMEDQHKQYIVEKYMNNNSQKVWPTATGDPQCNTFASPHGIPSSEGEALFLADGD